MINHCNFAISKYIKTKNLNIKIIAEGVETEEQQEFLMNESCDEIQGYYYFKPMKAEEIEPLLKIK